MKFITSLLLCFLSLSCFGADGYLARTNGNIVIGPGGSGGSSSTNFIANTNGTGYGTVTLDATTTTNLVVNGTGANFANALNVSSNLVVSNLTASRLVFSDAGTKLTSAAASGAVPVDADGSATTFAQVNTLAPGVVVTNGGTTDLNLTNSVRVVNGVQVGGTASPTSGINVSNSVSAAGSQILTNGNVNVGATLTAATVNVTGLTASRVALTDGSKNLSSAAASGAVPIDANGTATTADQIGAIVSLTNAVDVTVTALAAGNALAWSGTQWTNGPGGGGSGTVTSVSGPSDLSWATSTTTPTATWVAPALSQNNGYWPMAISATNGTVGFHPVSQVGLRRSFEAMFTGSSVQCLGVVNLVTVGANVSGAATATLPQYGEYYTTTTVLATNCLHNSSDFGEFPSGKSGVYRFVVALTNTTNVRCFVGMTPNTCDQLENSGQAPNNNYAAFRYSTNSANWFLCTGTGSNSEENDTGIAATTNPVSLEIVVNAAAGAAASIVGVIDGVSGRTNTVRMPSTAWNPHIGIQTLDTTAKAFRFYYAHGEHAFP